MAYSKSSTDYNYFIAKRDATILSALAVQAGGSRSGEKVPKFKDRIKRGFDATSPYSLDMTRVERRKDGEGTLKWINHFTPGVVTTWKYTGHFVTDTLPVSHLPYSTTEAEAKCLMKILRKIRSEQSHMNGQTSVGELREAIHMLRHPFESVRNLVYSHLTTLSKRKRDMMGYPERKRKRAWRSAVSDTWLETSFGLMPLIHDTKDIAESIARFVTDWPPRRSRVGHRIEVLDRKVTHTLHTGAASLGGEQLERVVETETTSFCTYAVGLEATSNVATGSLDRLRRVLGFTPENFVPALWEVMPWSWLVDYFSNVGDIIEAGTTDTSSVKWISKTVGARTEKRVITRWRDHTPYFTGDRIVSQPEVGSIFSDLSLKRATFSRTKPGSLGVPPLIFETPFQKVKKLANLIAVTGQFSGRSFEPVWADTWRDKAMPRGTVSVPTFEGTLPRARNR